MRSVVACLAIVAAAPVAAMAAPAKVTQSDPYPGIHHERWEDPAIPVRIHLVRVDLSSAELALYATSEANSGIKTSTFAVRKGAQVAINGGAFAPAGYKPRGLAMGDSQMWANMSPDTEATYVLHFRRVGEHTVATILTADEVTQAASLPAGTEAVISGRPLLVRNGVVVANFDGTDPIAIPYQRAPRSAVGISVDGYRMWLVTVDGWQAASAGLTAAELATFLRARGAHTAMGLDIGGASTLVLGDPPVPISAPSDGIERAVANHIAVKWGERPFGQLVGAICKTDIINCPDSEKLTGVKVILDDGRSCTTGVGTCPLLYSFTNVTPRLACVTAKKTGYRTTTACKIVTEGAAPPTFNSLVLPLGVDPVDAGVPDAGDDPIDPVDAGIDPDHDAGNPQMGAGGGCCNTGGDHPPGGAAVLVAVVAFALGRRRGTKA